MRAAAPLLILWVFSGMGSLAAAQEIAISGRVADGVGTAVAGAEIRLIPILSPFDQTELELAGVAAAQAVTQQRTGADGTFRVTAPEPGFWKLIAEAPGHAPMEFAFRREPLLEAATVPQLELLPARTIRVTVEDPSGAPAEDAWIEAWTSSAELPRSRAARWQPHVSPQRSTAGAPTTVIVPQQFDVELQAWQQGYRSSAKASVVGGAARLRLQAGVERRLLVADSAGEPVSGAVLRVGEVEWPLAHTGPDGLAGIHGDGESAQVTILTADGRSAVIRLDDDEGLGDEPFEFRLGDTRTLSGRVAHSETRSPVAAAFVYPAGAVGRYVKTDNRGDFELQVPAESRPFISAAAPRFLLNGSRADSTSTTLTIALEPAVSLPGLVLEPAGDPVAGAEVFARPYGDSMKELRTLVRSPSRQTTTDAEGRFIVPRLKEGLPYSIATRIDGFATAEVIVRDLEATAGAGGVVLRLESGTTLTGRVLAPDGRGVAGASLTLERSEVSAAMRYVGRDPGQPRPFRFEFSTDGEGEFSFADTPTGEFNLEVQARGFARQVLPVFEIEVGMRSHDLGLINLELGVELAGRVVDPDGLPLADAKISLRTREGVMFSGSFGPERHAFSGADGSFSFSDRQRGEFLDLTVELAGFASTDVPRVAVPPENLLEIELVPAVTLRGRVLDPEGQPISEVSIEVAREGGGTSFGGRIYNRPDAEGRSDELGRFEVVDIKPGTVRVSADATGWLPIQVGDLELVAGREPEDLEIELQRGATVSGRVLGPDGTPRSEAMIAVQGSPDMRFSGATSDGAGNYSLAGVEPGMRMIGAHHEGLQAVKELEVEPGENRLDFYFEAGVEISGTVVSPAGEPVEGAVLSLSAPGVRSYGRSNSVRSDAAGAFSIENVLPGLFELTAEHPAFGTTTLEEPLEIGAAPVSGLQVRLAAGVEVLGSVLGATAEDLVSIEVVAVKQQGGSYKEGRVDSDGGYRIANLSSGAWQIWAQSATGRQTSEHLEIGEGESQVTLDLEFKDGLVLSGRVLNRGAPLGGAWVSAGSKDTENGASAQTDHQGRFRLTGLEKGAYALQVSDFLTGLSHREEIELLRDDEILIELDGTAISGQVTKRRGNGALSGVAILLEAITDSDGDQYRVPKGAITDSAGRFRLADISPGTYRVRASKTGYATQSQVLDVDDGALEGIEFALDEAAGLSMTVLLSTGAPATSVNYAVLDPSGLVVQSGLETATSEGLVRLATIPDGDWSVMIEAGGAAVHVLRTQAPREDVIVKLEPAAALAVRVEELAHDATTVATLRITGADGLPFKSLAWNGGTVDHWRLAAGRATLGNLPPGRWIVSISTTDSRTWERSVNLAAGSNDEELFD